MSFNTFSSMLRLFIAVAKGPSLMVLACVITLDKEDLCEVAIRENAMMGFERRLCDLVFFTVPF